MNSVLIMPLERRPLRVAILSGDSLRKSALAGIVLGAGHRVSETTDNADVVIADGSVEHPDHPDVVRLSDVDDGEAAGALPERATSAQIVAAIEALAVGLSVRARDTSVGGFSAVLESKLHSLLTPREIEMLGALAEGLSNKAIARKIDISQHTVKFHLESLFRKLGVRSRAQAVLKGLSSMSRTRFDV